MARPPTRDVLPAAAAPHGEHPEIIAHHLRRDPNLTDEAAGHIAGLVRELYTSFARPPEAVRVRLRAAPTFKPETSSLLGELLQDMQDKLTGSPEADDE